MKNSYLLILILALFAVACSEPKKSKTSGNVRGGARLDQQNPGGATPAEFEASRLWQGVTKPSNWTADQFTSAVKRFGSASVAEIEISDTCGEVPTCSDGTKGGVRFVGDVSLSNNVKFAQLAAGQQVQVNAAASKIRFGIWDTAAVEGTAPGEIVIYINGATSPNTVTGNVSKTSANLTFTDKYGSIMLKGSINGNTYSGAITFTTNCQVSHGTGECPQGTGYSSEQQLGNFSFDATTFFR